jgi:hypothetical protein
MQDANTYIHLTPASTTVNAKIGPGALHTVSINEVGTSIVTMYDGVDGSGTIIAKLDPGEKRTYIYDVGFTVGLSVVVGAGAGTLDATVSFR